MHVQRLWLKCAHTQHVRVLMKIMLMKIAGRNVEGNASDEVLVMDDAK